MRRFSKDFILPCELQPAACSSHYNEYLRITFWSVLLESISWPLLETITGWLVSSQLCDTDLASSFKNLIQTFTALHVW